MPLPYGQGASTLINAPSIAYPGLCVQRSLTKGTINLAGVAAQVITITIAAPVPSTVYSATIDGNNVSVTTPATVTAAQLQTQIIDRLSTIPSISGSFTIAAGTSTTIILTSTFPSYSVLATSGAGLTIAITAPTTARRIRFGRILTGRPLWVETLQVAGLPTGSTEKVLGATQYSHGLVRDPGGLDGFVSGDSMSLVKEGQIWMEFSAPVVSPSSAGALYYRSVPDSTDLEGSGKLAFGITAPTDHTLLPGTWSLDSLTSTIADGRIVGLVTISV